MPTLHTLLGYLHALPRQAYLVAGAVVVLLAIAIWARRSRRRNASDTLQVISAQLGHLADSIDHLSATIAVANRPQPEPPPERRIGMSTLSR